MSRARGSTRSARRIQQIAFARELGLSFGRYAEKVILDRAIPDIRDGLKPVQRRIIYAMYESGNRPDKPYRKAAKTVGDVMGNYHPHGDSAIYDAMVRLAQPWKVRYPLVDGHGNFGSMDDDPAAAMRYTEARLSPIAMELMRDIEKDTVTWRPNFDEKTVEPTVLPSGYLNLLCNGASGVSAGFATEVPSHNLGEVMDASLAYMADSAIDTAGLMEHVKGPDFPTGGVLMGAEGLTEAYETGRGKVVLRGRYTIERQRDGKHHIIFTEIPYHVVKADLVRQMDDLRLRKAVHGVSDVRDESDREGLRVVIEVARSGDPEGVVAFYLKRTDLQVNYHCNMVTIVRRAPRQVGLKDIIHAFVEHRRQVVRRRSQHDLDKATARLHEVEGLIKAVDILDEVIATIRASEDRADARANLVSMGFDVVQADAILDLKLARLTNLQIRSLQGEQAGLRKIVGELRKILESAELCDEVVAEELRGVRERHGDERRTTIQAEVVRLDVAMEVTVKAQDVVVGVTDQGWIKRASMASFGASGGGRESSGVRPGDRMHDVLHTNTRHTLLIFTASGACYPIPVHQVPEFRWGDMGTALVNVCGIGNDDSVVASLTCETFGEDRKLVFVTERGTVKATGLKEFESSRTQGILGIRLADGDRLARVLETDATGELLLMTRSGRGIRFPMDQVSEQGRSARGVRGMVVHESDVVRDAVSIPAESDHMMVAVFTEVGSMKRTPVDQHPVQRRGGKGLQLIIPKARKPHRCVAVHVCGPKDNFEVVDSEGAEQILPAARIPVTVRDGKGFKPITVRRGTHVALVSLLPWQPEPEPVPVADEPDAGDAVAAAEGAGEPSSNGDSPDEPPDPQGNLPGLGGE